MDIHGWYWCTLTIMCTSLIRLHFFARVVRSEWKEGISSRLNLSLESLKYHIRICKHIKIRFPSGFGGGMDCSNAGVENVCRRKIYFCFDSNLGTMLKRLEMIFFSRIQYVWAFSKLASLCAIFVASQIDNFTISATRKQNTTFPLSFW